MQETTARVQFDKKYLIALVLPLVIEQVLAVTVGMADMIMVSGAGDTAVSGVSLVNTISNLLIYIFNALATGGAVVAAQALGAKKKKTGQIVANQLVLICLIVSVVISAVCIVFDRAILTLIYGKVEQAVMDQAVTYFFITGFSFPFIAVYDGASSLLRSMGKASISLFVSAIMNGLNILFNAIFVFGYNMGIAGVGYGTLISRVVAGIVVVFILRNEKYDLHIDKYFRFGWDGQIIGKILRIGIPSGIDNGMFQIGKLFTELDHQLRDGSDRSQCDRKYDRAVSHNSGRGNGISAYNCCRPVCWRRRLSIGERVFLEVNEMGICDVMGIEYRHHLYDTNDCKLVQSVCRGRSLGSYFDLVS